MAAPQLRVSDGILDLKEQSPLDGDGLLQFSGSWLFVPHQLLESAPIQIEQPIYADPGLFWQNSQENSFLKAERGTFFLTIHRSTTQSQLSFFWPELSRFKLYVNGKLLATHGVWRPDGSGEAHRGHRLVTLPDVETLNIALQTATDGPRWQPWPHVLAMGTVKDVQSYVQEHTIVLALILGGIFVTGIYHVLLFVLNRRKKAPLLLGLFCLVQVLRSVLGSEVDTVFQIWPQFNYELSYKLGYGAFFMIIPLYVHFLFLSFHGTVKVLYVWAYWIISGLLLVLTALTPVAVYSEWSQVYQLAMLLALFVMISSLVRSLRLRYRGSYTLLLGTLIVGGAALNDMLYFRGLIKTGELIPFAIFLFILLQASILSSQFAAAFRELRHTYKELTKIAHLHMVQRIAAGYRVEQTMPTGNAHGTVVCFDIVGSSRIRHPQFPEVVERIMGRCYGAISQGYNPKTLECRAYRIKEMGDGLLCSVGFPFHLKEGKRQSSEALELAIEFSKIFREEMQSLELANDHFCAIGIASGPIEGFFPRFGIKQYDLRGRAIVLANRYESMRNQVFQAYGLLGSVIFIQDEVYQDLTPEQQQSFQFWDCTLEQQRIRDDPKASRAWFRFVEAPQGTNKMAEAG